MPEPLTADSKNAAIRFRHRLNVEPPLLKILLYTDDPEVVPPDNPNKDLGLAFLLEHLNTRGLTFANLRVKWVSRYSSIQASADQKLDAVLERERQTNHQFDEIWVFGFHQSNTDTVSVKVFERGGPEAELTANEVSALEQWMETAGPPEAAGGGVLITGDHNHPRPRNAIAGRNQLCPDRSIDAAFLGRGRAIGRCVPRAGQLRKWENEPTNLEHSSNSTLTGFESDATPQELILCPLDAAGNPDPYGQPHPIFRYKRGWIKVFPDHVHEGQLIQPEVWNPQLWPGQARPHVVARGIDKRHCKLVDLLMTYNGDLVNLGRIVADSSWHHYFNINLMQFRPPGQDGSATDQLGQFYSNLAVWLAPRARRYEMALAMLWRLASYSALLEPLDDVKNIGTQAYSRLLQVASPCEVHELIQILVPARFGMISLPEGNSGLSALPSQEMLLGHILNAYHSEIIRDETDDAYQPREAREVIEAAFTEALKEHMTRLQQLAEKTQELIGLKSE